MVFLIFFFELLLLFFLSKKVTQDISILLYRLTKSEKWTISFLAFLFFPGTLIHELAHFFVAIVLFVPVGRIEFVPKIHGESVKLGSVAIGKTDPFRRALIGLAPLLVGLGILFFAIAYFTRLSLMPWYINIILLLVVIFEIGNTMFSSKRDVEGIPTLLITLMIIGTVCYLIGLRIPQSWMVVLFSIKTALFFQQLIFYMLFPLGVDIAILLLSKVVFRHY